MRALFLCLLFVGTASANWDPGFKERLTNNYATISLVSNLVGAARERHQAAFSGATNYTGDIMTTPVTLYDYSKIGTNALPASTNLVYTNVVIQSNIRQALAFVDSTIDSLSLYPGNFINHTVVTNGYEEWFLDGSGTNYPSAPPTWSKVSLFEAAGVGRITTNIVGTTTNIVANWTRQPPRNNDVILARAIAVPATAYIFPETNNPYAGAWTYDQPGVFVQGTRFFANGSYRTYKGRPDKVSAWTIALSLEGLFLSSIQTENSGFYIPPTGGLGKWDWGTWGISNIAYITNDWSTVAYSYTPEVFSLEVPQGNEDSGIFPLVRRVSGGSTNYTPLSVTISGSVIVHTSTPPTIAYGQQASIELTGATFDLTNRWLTITNLLVTGSCTNTEAVEVAYTGLIDLYGARGWQPYREDLYERYAVLNLMRDTLPRIRYWGAKNNTNYESVAISACDGAGSYNSCEETPAWSAYTGAVTPAWGANGYITFPWGHMLLIEGNTTMLWYTPLQDVKSAAATFLGVNSFKVQETATITSTNLAGEMLVFRRQWNPAIASGSTDIYWPWPDDDTKYRVPWYVLADRVGPSHFDEADSGVEWLSGYGFRAADPWEPAADYRDFIPLVDDFCFSSFHTDFYREIIEAHCGAVYPYDWGDLPQYNRGRMKRISGPNPSSILIIKWDFEYAD